jgi:hypothetical protein
MAGRYQGRHTLTDATGTHLSIEVFWQPNGWYWQRCQPHSEVVGPFTTSTEALMNAKVSGHQSLPSKDRLGVRFGLTRKRGRQSTISMRELTNGQS